ncbi:MAG TPA: T9SS type A sorting domain-containing protein [Patescibacteria group bacterium]|nr:T9SS type A sorting domain-containing protein [Patescibacteria group bacterium]
MDSFEDTSLREYVVNGIEIIGGGRIQVIADGWGTLVLPHQSFDNVLRVKTEQWYNDTNKLTGQITSIHLKSYNWYNNDYKSSLLKIDSQAVSSPTFNNNSVSISYLSEEITTSIAGNDILQPNSSIFYHSPNLYVLGNSDFPQQAEFRLYSLLGKLVHKATLPVKSQERAEIQLPDWISRGVYIGTLETESGSIVQSINITP